MQKFIHTNNSLKNLIFENTTESIIENAIKGNAAQTATNVTFANHTNNSSDSTSSTSSGDDKLQNVIKNELNTEKSDDSLETKQEKFITILKNEYDYLSNESKENFTATFIEIYLRKFIESLKLTNKKFFIITNNLLFGSSYDNYNDSFFKFILQNIDLNRNINNNYTKLCYYFEALIETFIAKQDLEKQNKELEKDKIKSDIQKIVNKGKKRVILDKIANSTQDNISLFNNSILGRFSKKEKINNKEIIDLISKYIKNESYNYLKHKNILSENSGNENLKINIHDLFNYLAKEVVNQEQEQILGINELILRKLNLKYEQIKERKGFLRGEKTITNDQFKKLLFDSISSVTNLNENQIVYLFDNINELNENKIIYKNLLNENKQKYSFNNIGKLIALAKLTFPDEENIVIDLVGFKKLKKNEDKFDFLFDKILFRWDLFYKVAYAEVICKSILENKDELLKAGIKIVGQLPDPGVQSKNASVVSSVLSSKIKTKLGKDKRDITDQDIQRELEESVADICLGILRMYDVETYNKYQKSIDDDIVAQYNQGGGWGFEKLFNVGDITKRVRHETTHKTSEQVKTRLLQQEVKKIIEAFIALTKTVKPDLQQDHKLFTGNIINENNLIYKQFKLLIEQQTDKPQKETEEKETSGTVEQEQETDDTKSDYKISVAKLKQVLQANGVLIYGKSAQNIDAKTRKESEHYMLEMFSSFLSINFDIEVTGVKKYKYDDLIRDQIIAAGNINTQPKEGQVSSERIQKSTQGSGLPTKIGDITLQQLVSLLNDAGKSDQLVRVLSAPEQNREETIQQIATESETKQQFLKARRGLPNLSKKITEILFKPENVVKIKTKLTGNYEFKDDKFNIDGLQKFFNIVDKTPIKFDDNLKDKFIEFTKEFLDFKGNSYEDYNEFVRNEIGCNILNKVFKKANINKKISTGFIDKLQNCRNGKGLKNLVGDTVYNAEIGKTSGGDKVDIEKTKTAIQTQFIEDTKLVDDLNLEESKKMSSGLILREGVRVSSVDEVMREFGELKREFRNIYRY